MGRGMTDNLQIAFPAPGGVVRANLTYNGGEDPFLTLRLMRPGAGKSKIQVRCLELLSVIEELFSEIPTEEARHRARSALGKTIAAGVKAKPSYQQQIDALKTALQMSYTSSTREQHITKERGSNG